MTRATWLLTAVLTLAAVANFPAATNWERFGVGPIALVLALLALVVARSGGERHHIHRRRWTLPSH